MTTYCSWNSRLTNIFTRPFVLWGLAALATQITVQWLFKHEELGFPAKPILSFLPALLAIFFVVALVQDIRKLDEMQRRIHLQAASTAFLLTVTLTFVFDGLESAGIYRATRSSLSTCVVLFWLAAHIFLALRYR